MKSPFPGMDPCIEQCGLWEDFHHALIEEIKNHLSDMVPERYLVRTGERAYVVYIENEVEQQRSFKADVTVVEAPNGPTDGQTNGAIAVAEPETESLPMSLRALVDDEFRETFIEIREANEEGRLVTCIEVLSPSNEKPDTLGWEQYQRKRQGLLIKHTANLVEIDLLRRGRRMPMVDPFPECPYILLVARNRDMPVCKVWRGHYRRRLPVIPVPLFKPDPDIQLDLQPMIDAIYTRSRYQRSIDYTQPLTPPLPPEDAAWLQQQIGKD